MMQSIKVESCIDFHSIPPGLSPKKTKSLTHKRKERQQNRWSGMNSGCTAKTEQNELLDSNQPDSKPQSDGMEMKKECPVV
ncbi:hypothetical protein OUZ56_001226 [Daphnia magna]|uniref:Uncharacterized protein n=1 Tax=Daphnia magna TaxID=35525 RepID=A0ABR0A234_9CRUS|nr:hypothetical protein OUZ56_001226 [Daphnia magna]